MSAQARAGREAVRFQAAALFDEGADTAAIAQQLRDRIGWANLEGGLGNLAARSLDALAVLVRSLLKPVQYSATLIDGFVAETGLTLDLR